VSYQEIKRISRGKKWAMLALMLLSVFIIFCKKVVRAQNTFEIGGSASAVSGNWTCTHSPYSITYTFNNYLQRGASQVPVAGAQVSKCEPVYVSFAPSNGLWGGKLVSSVPLSNARLCASNTNIPGGKGYSLYPSGFWAVGSDCNNINIINRVNLSTAGEVRYINGLKYSRAQLTGWVSIGTYCDSGMVKGEHAECTTYDWAGNKFTAVTDWKNEPGSLGGMKNTATNWWWSGQGPFRYGYQESPSIKSSDYAKFPVDLTDWTYRAVSPCGVACGACSACGGGCGGSGGGACACGACACGACACEPPADILSCVNQTDCLNRGTLGQLDSGPAGSQGKGVFKTPTMAALAPVTGGANLSCTGNSCRAYASGAYTFNEQVNATQYYGQCVNTDYEIDIKLAGNVAASPANPVTFNVVNRAPSVAVSFPGLSQSVVEPGKEVQASAVATDPDCQSDAAHTDKITQVKWSCKDAAGNTDKCFFKKAGDADWHSTLTDNPSPTRNPYTSNVLFKADTGGKYTVTATAQDSDSAKGTGSGNKVISVDIKPESCSALTDKGTTTKYLCEVPGTATFNVSTAPPGANNAFVAKHQWKCDYPKGNWVDGDSTHNCVYDKTGDFYIRAKQVLIDGTEVECAPDAQVHVVNQNYCIVEGKVAGSDKNPSPTINANLGDQIQANIQGACTDDTQFTFNASNGQQQTGSESAFQTTFTTPSSSAGYKTIKGTMYDTKKDKTTTCEDARILLKEKVKFR